MSNTVPEFICDMMKINDEIKTRKILLSDLYQKLEETETEVKRQEATVMDLITEETENGKPKYSNADKRNAEMKIRLSSDVLYAESKNRLAELKKTISSSTIELDHLSRQFDIYKILGQYKTK